MGGGEIMATLIINHNSNGSTRRCDATCYNAKHDKCRCICGGKNHGKGFEQAKKNTIEMIEADPSIIAKIVPRQEEIKL